MLHVQMAKPAETAFESFWHGGTAARQESMLCAAALLQQHARVAGSSLTGEAAPTFAAPPAGLAKQHQEILFTLSSGLKALGHNAAASSISGVALSFYGRR